MIRKLWLKIIAGIIIVSARVEQLVARRAHNPKVAGSNPAPATQNIGPQIIF